LSYDLKPPWPSRSFGLGSEGQSRVPVAIISVTTDEIVAYIVFVLVATIGVGAPVVIYFALGDRSAQVLERLKTWMAEHNAVIMAVPLLVIGVKLIGDAISGFSS
jgi:hypothetical protein